VPVLIASGNHATNKRGDRLHNGPIPKKVVSTRKDPIQIVKGGSQALCDIRPRREARLTLKSRLQIIIPETRINSFYLQGRNLGNYVKVGVTFGHATLFL
jgi:hypothetical protein